MASTLLIAIIALVALYIIAHFLKGAFKLILKLAVIAAIVAGLIYILPDLQNVQRNFPASSKLFLLDDAGAIRGGFIANGTETILVESFGALQELKNKDDLAGLRGMHYRLILIRPEALKDLEEAELFENVTLSAAELSRLLTIPRPRSELAKLLAGRIGIPEVAEGIEEKLASYFPTDDAARSYVFAAMAKEAQSNPAWLSISINQGHAQVYPDTVAFKLLKQIPKPVLRWFSLKAVKEEASERLSI